jgi:hypothetical protein
MRRLLTAQNAIRQFVLARLGANPKFCEKRQPELAEDARSSSESAAVRAQKERGALSACRLEEGVELRLIMPKSVA